jgi:hypothetical protein
MNNKIPTWVLVYLGIAGVAALLFGAMGYLNPDMQFSGWEAFDAAGALSLAGPLGLYIARNIATGLVSLFAIWRRSKDMVIVALLLRLFTELFDTINALAGSAGIGGAALALVMLIIDAVALWSVLQEE